VARPCLCQQLLRFAFSDVAPPSSSPPYPFGRLRVPPAHIAAACARAPKCNATSFGASDSAAGSAYGSPFGGGGSGGGGDGGEEAYEPADWPSAAGATAGAPSGTASSARNFAANEIAAGSGVPGNVDTRSGDVHVRTAATKAVTAATTAATALAATSAGRRHGRSSQGDAASAAARRDVANVRRAFREAASLKSTPKAAAAGVGVAGMRALDSARLLSGDSGDSDDDDDRGRARLEPRRLNYEGSGKAGGPVAVHRDASSAPRQRAWAAFLGRHAPNATAASTADGAATAAAAASSADPQLQLQLHQQPPQHQPQHAPRSVIPADVFSEMEALEPRVRRLGYSLIDWQPGQSAFGRPRGAGDCFAPWALPAW